MTVAHRRIAAALAGLLAATTLAAPAHAATADRYTIQLAAWIPQAYVTGFEPTSRCMALVTHPWDLATYNGNNHVGFDGGDYKALVTYEFTYDGERYSDIDAGVKYGPTNATDAVCSYHGQVTKAGGVKAVTGGVQLWMSTSNPLVSGAPAIDAALDVSFRSRDRMVVKHSTDKFPSHGFRVIKNGRTIATAVDYDASCVGVTGYGGAKNLGLYLAQHATPVSHDIDLRVAGQNYFGPCGKTAPARLSYPAPVPTVGGPSVPTPKPGNKLPIASFTAARVTGAGNQVRLDASASRDPDGSITAYRWYRGSTQIATGKVVTVPLGQTTTSAQVTLSVTDNQGATGTASRTLTVANRAPVITGVNPAAGATFMNITPTFSASASDPDGDALQYSYQLRGNGVDIASGWVGGGWTVPAHRIDPGLTYSWTVTVRDNRGGTATRTSALTIASLPTAKRLVALSTGAGYWQVASDGGVFSYGKARFFGSLPGLGIRVNNVIGMARTPDDGGYWLVGSDGGVFAFGDAPFHGSMAGKPMNGTVVGMAPTKSGKGYWLVSSDGGVFAFGDAAFHGSMGGKPLNAAVVGMSVTPSGNGYWLGAKDGGVFAFGDAPFYGSMGGKPLNAPVVDLQVTPSGQGYWLAAEDGGVFSFGDAHFYGSMGGKPLNGRVTSISPTPTAQGYWLNGCDGGVFAFGDAPFLGSNAVYGCRGM